MKKTLLAFALVILVGSAYARAQASQGFSLLANTTATSYTVSNLTCPDSSSCFFQVTSLDATGHESTPSACLAGVPCFTGNQAIAVIPPTGTHTVALTWTASPTSGATYNVYVYLGPNPPSNIKALVN